jgi:serine/threonine protein kinase
MNTCPKCGAVYKGAEMFCPNDGTRLGGTREGRTARTSSPPENDPLIGTVIQGRYRVIEQIGEGGMGVVYIAEHVEIEKKVALKVLRDDFSKRPEVVERFRQEARSASKIGHAHIVDVTDFGQLNDGGVYFAMEYLQGQGLSELIHGKTVPVERAVGIIKQIARALQAAHKLGIVHRDLKPENIFLVEREEERDFVKVLDFGIAKISDRDSDGKRLTKTGMIFGTPEYMSPEQASGKPLDNRVDVYALGCIMFEMFAGRVPFDAESFMAVLTQHMFEPVPAIESFSPDTDVPKSVRQVVYKAMAKDRDERYSDMAALEADLDRALIDAGYIVESHKREGQSYYTPTHGTSADGADEDAKTAMDWTPSSGTYAKRSSIRLGLIAFIAAAVVIIGGGGALFWSGALSGKGAADKGAPVAAASVPSAPEKQEIELANQQEKSDEEFLKDFLKDSEASQKNEVEEQEPTEMETLETKKIDVTIKSDPASAVILIEGMGQVCSKSPCEVQLDEGQPVEIEARLDGKNTKMTFTPSAQNKEIILALKKTGGRGERRPKSGPKTGGKDEDKTKVDSSGLKIPGIFKED